MTKGTYSILVPMNTIIWYSKMKNTFEASSSGSGFVAVSIAIDMIDDMYYKLICF